MKRCNNQSSADKAGHQTMIEFSALLNEHEQGLSKLLSVAVQKQITRDVPERWGGCQVYGVEHVWAADALKNDQTISVAIDPETLRMALSNNCACAVFIPRGSSLTTQMAQKICSRTGHVKTIYIEETTYE